MERACGGWHARHVLTHVRKSLRSVDKIHVHEIIPTAHDEPREKLEDGQQACIVCWPREPGLSMVNMTPRSMTNAGTL